ncbi:MAG: DUF3644 domain-containing protein [Rhodospirillales bacterium]
MNYRGSYRKLLGNAKAALMAAIEIYNKPMFEYRDECVVILLLNAWELILKTTLSKNGESIFYPKKRKQPYRTLSWQDALTKAERFFPATVAVLPVRRNLELLGTYRDNAVHFYNASGFGALLYALAQTCIVNLRDFLDGVFAHRLEDEINWQLLPIGISPPVDVVSYISGDGASGKPSAVQHFLAELAQATEEVKAAGQDTGRLMTVFNLQLQSVKKIGEADAVVGVAPAEAGKGPLTVVKRQDPNITHPLRQKEVVSKIGNLHGRRFTSYVFQAIVWKHGIKSQSQYCWQAKEGVLTRYSNDLLAFIKRLTSADLNAALKDYQAHMKAKQARSMNSRRSG